MDSQQEILQSLIISLNSCPLYLASSVIKAVTLILKTVPQIFELFDPDSSQISSFKLSRFFDSSNYPQLESETYDLILFFCRYYPKVLIEELNIPSLYLKKIQDYSTQQIWKLLDTVVVKIDKIDTKLKVKSKQTASSLGEIFTYLENMRSEQEDSKSQAQELKNLKQQINKMQTSMTDEFQKSDLENRMLSPKNFKNSRKSIKYNLSESNSNDQNNVHLNEESITLITDLKDRMEMVELNQETLQDKVDFINKDSIAKSKLMKETIITEIDSISVFREKVNLEIESFQKAILQFTTNSRVGRQSEISSNHYSSGGGSMSGIQKRVKALATDIKFLTIENTKVKESINKIQRFSERLKQDYEDQIYYLNHNIDKMKITGQYNSDSMGSMQIDQSRIGPIELIFERQKLLNDEIREEMKERSKNLESRFQRLQKEKNPLRDAQVVRKFYSFKLLNLNYEIYLYRQNRVQN